MRLSLHHPYNQVRKRPLTLCSCAFSPAGQGRLSLSPMSERCSPSPRGRSRSPSNVLSASVSIFHPQDLGPHPRKLPEKVIFGTHRPLASRPWAMACTRVADTCVPGSEPDILPEDAVLGSENLAHAALALSPPTSSGPPSRNILRQGKTAFSYPIC